jgi:glutamine cyclotransferase
VLNGIAAIPGSRNLLITGKLWPHIFEVELVPASSP